MTRIIFVGIHNKPGMEPLDSRTKSGKIIDEVIKRLEDFEHLKCNLFDLDETPNKEVYIDWPTELARLQFDWLERVKLNQHDIVVLLGDAVNKYFPHELPIKTIYVPHPASRHIKREQYIQSLIDKILQQ